MFMLINIHAEWDFFFSFFSELSVRIPGMLSITATEQLHTVNLTAIVKPLRTARELYRLNPSIVKLMEGWGKYEKIIRMN